MPGVGHAMWRALKNALKRLVAAIRGRDRRSVVPGFLRPIDTGALARQLNLNEVGAERGRKELPDAGDTVFDAVEQTIVQNGSQCARSRHSWFWRRRMH
jgi:hypothetical protein